MNITYEEQTLMSIYNTNGTRAGLIVELREMQGYLSEEEADLAELTDSAMQIYLGKIDILIRFFFKPKSRLGNSNASVSDSFENTF